jgi:hypothetical protein
MAPPPVTARTLPTHAKIRDGFPTTIALSLLPGIDFYEKTLNPPGYDGGDMIDVTTMLNIAWRTMLPRSLKTLTPMTINALYSAYIYIDVTTLINAQGAASVHFPDGDVLSFYCALNKMEIGQHAEGAAPEAVFTLTPTNWDYVNLVEAGPILTSVSGT